MKKKMLILGVFVCMIGLVAQAQEVGSIGSDADTWMNGATAMGASVFMDIYGASTDNAGYVRFDLSSLSISSIEDASITLTVSGGATRNDTVVAGRFALYGLNNVAGNTPQNWNESTLTESGTNPVGSEWNGAVPMDLTAGRVTDLDADTGTGTTETIVNGPGGGWDAGTTITVTGAPLVAFLQSRVDDGGLATFIVGDPDGASRGYGLATKENATEVFRPVLVLTYLAGGSPSDPVVTPDNGDGTVGDLVDLGGGTWQVQNVGLNFVAAGDPNDLHEPQYKINPDIVSHNIYLQTGAPDDPNLYLYANVAENIVDPYTHDPNVSYGPLPAGLLQQATTYQWQVEEVLDNGSGGYPAGDPNNIMGSVWSFVTPSATPEITSISYHQLTDANGDASLTIVADSIANNYRWYKVVGEQDSDVNLEGDDVMLTDGGFYSGTQTLTLSIAGMASDGSDDAQYYAIAYNGVPGVDGIASPPSAVSWVWYPRLVNHYTFEDMDTSSDPNGVTTDIVSGFNAHMKSNDIGDDVPSLEPNVVAGLAGTYSLKFDNPQANDPNNFDTQYAQVAEPYAGSYADMTISAWVYWNGGGNWQRIVDFGNDTDYYMFLSANTGGENGIVRFAVRDFNEQSVSAPTGSLPIGEWTFVTATLEGDTGKVFINGEWVATSPSLTSNAVDYGPTTNNWIGRSQWSGDAYFNGLIDDLKIYNYARTTEQVAQDYMDVKGEWVCDTENYDLAFDYNDDCVINLADFAEVAQGWLDSYRILP